ncbi:HAD family phosphatase [Tessaracoccus sp. MC1756]|uniref:HAD family hydrolase n=1 Tax=Tessaracoccus sp. MC1756 TaxID=2760311 RepID=UPI0015FEF451|nr:HAD family phosphatase [Tessaracoccus sp. MC1756]MBB1510812.1 HAD family phosphatase [Tessaracoccus sp. MC1756]
MGPQAIVFDMDGTLTDTEEIWDRVRRGLAADAGLTWPDGSTQAMMGMSTQEWARHLVEVVGLPYAPEEAAQRTIEGMATAYRRGITMLTGAVEAVRRMAERYPIAIASSSPRLLIDTGVEVMGLADVVRVSVSTEEVERGKPAPDGYLRACELLGVDPARSVAVEDATNGIKSALAAGMAVVAVPPHFHPPAAELLAKTTTLETLDELTHELVEGLVAD